ncbi:MAG: hypothetical protein LBR60_05160 [Fibrobacter sp.]|nr:hypothetical protein [Fibrobacter sp.]
MKVSKLFRQPLLYFLILLAASYFVLMLSGRAGISNVQVSRNGVTETASLPYAAEMAYNEVFTVSFNFSVKNTNAAKLHLVPDDCLKEIRINGKAIHFNSESGLCSYSQGATVDFSKYVQKGTNLFEFRIINSGGGPGGLRIEKPYLGISTLSLMHFVFAFLLLMVIALILKKFRFKWIPVLIILFGVGVRLIAYSYMGPMENPYDVQAHLEYIEIVANEKRIPAADEAWSTYHPPLYYLISAAVKNITSGFGAMLGDRALQQIPLLLSFACVILGVAFILALLGNNKASYLAALVAVSWSGFVFAAPRIGNDSLFYFGALFCMYFAQKYWFTRKNSAILLATLGAAIALAAKSSGLVILGIWGIIYILSVFRTFKTGSWKTLLASAFILALFAGLSNHRMILDVFEGKKPELVGNAGGLHNGLKVQNAAGNYLYFDLKDYQLTPYTNAWEDRGGRQYFWNYALKSSLSLYREIRLMNYPLGRILATALNTLALFIFALALWGLLHMKSREIPAMLFTVFLFAALLYLRISYPYASSGEFRYIFPVLFPIACFAVRGTQTINHSGLRKLSYTGMFVFSILSFIFVLSAKI